MLTIKSHEEKPLEMSRKLYRIEVAVLCPVQKNWLIQIMSKKHP